MKLSEKFELQIKRIHELIEQQGSEITWDDRIPDPDNPLQLRQIDITIKRENKLTFVECRIHQEKQDVQWIEELIGRRASLKADAVIAVSASGFTSGAIIKAKNFGIILRDIISLTEEEISRWGYLTKIELNFCQFEDTYLTLKISKNNNLTPDDIRIFLEKNAIDICSIIANKYEEINPKGTLMVLNGNLGMKKEVEIKECALLDIIFSTKIYNSVKELAIPSVVAYDDPGIPLENRSIFVEKFNLGDFEITKSSNNVSLLIDLTQINSPPNCLFRSLNVNFGTGVKIKKIETLGNPILDIRLPQLNVSIVN